MSAEEIFRVWFLWLGVAAIIVVAAAALLITILALARRIGSLAQTALEVVGEIEQNTKPIWQLNATNKVAKDLLAGAHAIEGNAGGIVTALTHADQARAA